MTPEVETAIDEIRQAFSGHQVDIEPETQGGVYVVVHDLFFGNQYAPSHGWVGFLINFQYPRSDVYPHLIDASIQRVNGNALGDGISGPTDWRGKKVWQISRKSNHLDPTIDTAALKLAKVLQWLNHK